MNRISILVVAIFALVTQGCQAQGFHLAFNPQNILYVSTTGNDATAHRANTNWSYATIKAAIQASSPGDKIIVGAGTFTGNDGVTLTLPALARLIGAGTNNTICDIQTLVLNGSNEVAGISFTNRSGLIGQGQIHSKLSGGSSYNYLHDLLVKASSECLTIGASTGYNVVSNCVFDTKEWGAEGLGTNFFYNCAVVKNADAGLSFGAKLFGAIDGQACYLYWSGGSITSTTNSNAGLNDPTNNWGVYNGTGSGYIYVQSATISTPAGGKEIYGISTSTNYIAGITWTASKTNLAAVIVSNAPPLFSSTNQLSGKWQGAWRAGTPRTPPRLTIPTGN
jgi:hypothetical protein